MAQRYNKTTVNFWLDFFLLVIFMLLCWVSVVIRYVFPPATKAEGWTLWGKGYLFWSDVQFATLCILAASILLHVMLHWTWVCGVVENWRRKRRGKGEKPQQDTGSRTLWGVGLLIIIFNIVGLCLALAVLMIKEATI